jgi:hypothetical protein
MPNLLLTRRDARKKFSLRTGSQHIFQLRRFKGHILEVEDVHFHHDSAVLLPDIEPAPAPASSGAATHQDRITGLAVLAACFRHAQQNPGQKLLVAGHTDTTGAPDYNFKLSQMRADNVYAALMGERDKWVKIAEDKHKVRDYKQILRWVARTWGWECDPAAVDDTNDAQTRACVKEFQKCYNLEFNASISVDGDVGPQTWGAFFDMYMLGLADLLKAEGINKELVALRGELNFLDAGRKAVGCGESFPIEQARADNYRSQINRRVEILFFDPGEEPQLNCHPGPGKCAPAVCEIYNTDIYDFIPIPVRPVTITPVDVSVHLVEIRGLYKPGHNDPVDIANGTTRRSGYLKGYKSDDDLGRIFINHIPRTDPTVNWDTISKKNKQFIELTVEVRPTAAALPASARVIWEWEDPDDPSNESSDVRDDAGQVMDPNDYSGGTKTGANADDNAGTRDFPSADAGTGAEYEEIDPYAMTPIAGTRQCETIILNNISKVRLHCSNVGGDNFRVKVRIKDNPRLNIVGADQTGIMTMWKRIDVEYRKMDGALDLPVSDVPPFFEKAFVQMDFTPPLPTPKKAFLSRTDKDFDSASSRYVKKPPTGVFEHEFKPGWFLLVSAHEAVEEIGTAETQLLYEGPATLKEHSYSGGEHGEVLEITASFAEDVAFVLFDEGDKEVLFSVWRKDDNTPSAGKIRLHLSPNDYQSDFVAGTGDKTGLMGDAGEGGAYDRTDNQYPGHTESLPAGTWTVGGYGFGASVNVRVFSPGALATSGVSPSNTFRGKEYFAGRTVIFSMHPGNFRPARGVVTINGTWTAGNIATITINGIAQSYTVVAGDTPGTIAAALITGINNNPALKPIVKARRRRSNLIRIEALARGPAGNSITLAASATSSSGTIVASSATLTDGGEDRDGLITTIVHELGHAFGFPHKCGYHTFENPPGNSCAMNYFNTWLYKPGTRTIERFNPGSEGKHFCALHIDGIRKVHMEDNPAMWKF